MIKSHWAQGRCTCLLQDLLSVSMMHTDAFMPNNSDIEDALSSLEKASESPSLESCIYILQLCRQKKRLTYALRAHRIIYESNLIGDRVLGSYIVAMFAESGSMVDAQYAFDQMDRHNDFSWTYLLQGYTDCGESQHALALLPKLKEELSCPSSHTYQALLKACTKLKSAEKGFDIHAEVVREGLETEAHLGCLLVDLYAKCNLIVDAQAVFDDFPDHDIAMWSALVAGHSDHGFDEEVLSCIMEMRQEGVSPSSVTFICSLKGCKSKTLCQKIHIEIVKIGFDRDPIVGNMLVDMYGRYGTLQDARWVFTKLRVRCIISWTALITGHVAHNASEDALIYFNRMQQDRVVPDANIFACMLKACGNLGAVNIGQNLHALIVKRNNLDEKFTRVALVDMYCKCGLLLEAEDAFHKLSCQDVVLWTALLMGHALSGDAVVVFRLFSTMVIKSIQPDRVTFLIVLSVCACSGLVETGILYFQLMWSFYGIFQGIEHYNCLVELLGGVGQLHAAAAMLDGIPVQPNLVTWVTLLGAYQNENNLELGKNAFEYALKLHGKHMETLLLAKQILRWKENHDDSLSQM